MAACFITATGTGVGKTYVTCALVRALRRRQVHVSALKPIISGYDPAAIDDSDTGKILEALGRKRDTASAEAISPWRFKAAISADMAAAREGRDIAFNDVIRFCQIAMTLEHHVFLIEGVGGLMAPIDRLHTNREWIGALGIAPILVAGSYLGTISHTLTALEAMRAKALIPRAVVISESEESPVPPLETAAVIARHTGINPFIIARGSEAPDNLVDMVLT